MALGAKCKRATMAAAAQHQYPDWSGADALGQAVDGPEDSELPDVMSSLVDCPAPVLDRRLDALVLTALSTIGRGLQVAGVAGFV